MTKDIMNYNNTIIYKIQHNENPELIYVGHTTNFNQRVYQHKHNCKNRTYKLYTMINENGGWECFTMVMIEKYPCHNRLEACQREDQVIRELKTTMNASGAVFDEERRKEYMKVYLKVYHNDNKDVLNKKIQCECGTNLIHRNMKRHYSTKTHQAKIDLKSK